MRGPTLRHPLPVVLLAAALAGSGCSVGASSNPSGPPVGSGPVTEVVISTDDGIALRYVPSTVHAPSGVAVRITFQNRSAAPHNLTFLPPHDERTRTIVEAGGADVVVLAAPQPGAIRFECTIHQGMEGVVVVQ